MASQLQTRRVAGIAAAVVFIGGAALQVARTVSSPPPGLTPMHSHVVTILLAVLWCSAAAICVFRKRRFAVIPILGAFAFLPHFVIARAAGGVLELAYLVALPVLAVLVWMTFKGKLEVGEVSTTPAPPRAPGRPRTMSI